MNDIAATTAAILKAHAPNSDRAIDGSIPLHSLGVDALELALVVMDLEDHFQIDFPFDPDADAHAFATVAALTERVERLVGAKLGRRASAEPGRPKSLWLRAGCAQR